MLRLEGRQVVRGLEVCAVAFVVGVSGVSVATAGITAQVEPVVRLYEPISVEVEGAAGASAVAVGLAGTWTWLRADHGRWLGVLASPGSLGIYPLDVKTRPGGKVVADAGWLRVFEPGTLSRPSFATPDEVATWWVETIAHSTVVAVRRWPQLLFDRRDARLHQLFVVAYNTPARDYLGMWITAVRDGYAGRWRLLEASIFP
jgi:hypothetical protein